ncbi:PapD-like protein [Pelagophyceae sp. CCMP2097]|nr:PapD-like protein [Pelagophyceae sp. CCMP2097]|mmetsp:Transcript_2828/g.8329  ORF Transcript_2828/g.8329 Transcript_2828/m.8329 type:complete len:263 (-) Transcript_2828:233-1021(-)
MSLIFTPDERLLIQLGEGAAVAQLVLRNDGGAAVAFKVKTTTPDRYLVKPNHGLIHPGQSAEISIVIVQTKKKDLLQKLRFDTPAKSTDKFLVQSASIDGDHVLDLESKSSTELAEAITRLFLGKDKRDVAAKKLVVEFANAIDPDTGPVADDSDALRQSLHKAVAASAQPAPIPGTPEAMFAEIVALRKKYDDLVAFTVNLTAERDALTSDLNAALKSSAAPPPRGEAAAVAAPQSAAAYHAVLVALAAFLLGRYLPLLLG